MNKESISNSSNNVLLHGNGIQSTTLSTSSVSHNLTFPSAKSSFAPINISCQLSKSSRALNTYQEIKDNVMHTESLNYTFLTPSTPDRSEIIDIFNIAT